MGDVPLPRLIMFDHWRLIAQWSLLLWPELALWKVRLVQMLLVLAYCWLVPKNLRTSKHQKSLFRKRNCCLPGHLIAFSPLPSSAGMACALTAVPCWNTTESPCGLVLTVQATSIFPFQPGWASVSAGRRPEKRIGNDPTIWNFMMNSAAERTCSKNGGFSLKIDGTPKKIIQYHPRFVFMIVPRQKSEIMWDHLRSKHPHWHVLELVLQYFTGWWFEPLWKILVNWDDYSQYMGK